MNERILKSSVSIAALLTAIIASPAFAQDDAARDEITVTGSFVKTRSQADQISPITSIGADELSDVAAFNPADLVNTLTVNAGAQNNADGFNQSNSIGTTNINLRGLGVSSTLVLLNGRRQTQSAAATLTGDQFVDLNSLVPTIALDRVEILEDGATALYGSDAVAGVVNFLTRDTFTGFEANANFVTSTEDSQRDVQASVLWGGEWGGANLIAAFSFFDRTDLLAAERSDEFEQRNALSTFGQPGTFLPLAGPNAFQRQPDPACAATAETDPSVVGIIPAGPIAGTCQFDFGDFFTLVADEQRFQGYTKFTYDAGVVRIAIDGGYTANDIEAKTTPSQPILFPEVITPANPGNLTGFPELFFGRVLGAGSAPFTDTYESDTWRVSAVVSGDLNDTWSWEAGFVRAQNQYDTVRSDTAVDRFQAAIAGVGGPNNDQFFNPRFGAANDPAVIDDILEEFTSEATADLLTIDGYISGDLFDLPGGPIGVALGGQYRKDQLEYDFGDDVNAGNLYFNRQADDFDGELDVYAFFAETILPVIEGLEISAAVRYENFGDDVDTVDPKVGFIYRPSDSFSLRGTYGTSFRAPGVYQLEGILSVPARIFDPAINDFATISQTTTGDPDNPVQPQTSDTYNLGFTFQPIESGLTVNVDYWRFEYSNFITPENATAVVAADPFGPQAIRDPATDTLLAVTTFFRNAGRLNTDGLDISVRYNFDLSTLGQFVAAADVTRVLTYDLNDPVAGNIDGLGQRNFTNFGSPTPEWRFNLGLGWENGPHSANAFGRYIGDYFDENNGDARIRDNFTVDAQYNLNIGELLGDDTAQTVLTAGVRNLFDLMPPDVVSRTGYDSLTHSPIGRQVYVGANVSF